MLAEFLEKLTDALSPSKNSSDKSTGADNEQGDSSQQQSTTTVYKCSQCGKAPLSGPVLYCDGCSQYMCYSCGVSSGDMIFDCPNCAIEAHRVNL